MLSKDVFWNSKNVMVYDSYISGEYLGWNVESKLANPQTSMLIFCNLQICAVKGKATYLLWIDCTDILNKYVDL